MPSDWFLIDPKGLTKYLDEWRNQIKEDSGDFDSEVHKYKVVIRSWKIRCEKNGIVVEMEMHGDRVTKSGEALGLREGLHWEDAVIILSSRGWEMTARLPMASGRWKCGILTGIS